MSDEWERHSGAFRQKDFDVVDIRVAVHPEVGYLFENIHATSVDRRAIWIRMYEDSVFDALRTSLGEGTERLTSLAQWLARGQCSNDECEGAGRLGGHVSFHGCGQSQFVVPLCGTCNQKRDCAVFTLREGTPVVEIRPFLGLNFEQVSVRFGVAIVI